MDDELFDLLRCCTVKIVSGTSHGTGFFVGRGWILTCAHVLQRGKTIQNPDSVIWDDQTINATIVEVLDETYPDIALLQTEYCHRIMQWQSALAEPSEEQETKRIPESLPRQPPLYCSSVPEPNNYVARPELESSLAALFTIDGTASASLVIVTGIGGTGKTSLCRKVVNSIYKKNTRTIGLFWFNFNEARIEGVNAFFRALLSYVKLKNVSQWDDQPFEVLHTLIDLLSLRPYFLVLDGVETLQNQDSHQPTFGEIDDRILREFLHRLISQVETKVLVISRLAIADLIASNSVARVSVGEFSKSQAVACLQKSGLHGSHDVLSSIATHFGRHALSLSIVAQFVRRKFSGVAERFLSDFISDAEHPVFERLSLALRRQSWSRLQRTGTWPLSQF